MSKLADVDPENFTLWRDREGQVDGNGVASYGDVIVEPAPAPPVSRDVDLYAELAED